MKSFNQNIICEPYKGSRGIKSKVNSGIAMIQQKNSVVGLKVLVDAFINKDITIKAGSTVFIKESILYQSADQYSKPLDCEEMKTPFVVASYAHVTMVKEGK